MIRSRVVTNKIFFSIRKGLFSFTWAQYVLSYHLLYVPWMFLYLTTLLTSSNSSYKQNHTHKQHTHIPCTINILYVLEVFLCNELRYKNGQDFWDIPYSTIQHYKISKYCSSRYSFLNFGAPGIPSPPKYFFDSSYGQYVKNVRISLILYSIIYSR